MGSDCQNNKKTCPEGFDATAQAFEPQVDKRSFGSK
jgi:hypothetical protein